MDRRTIEKWLTDHGFALQPGRKTSHRQFVRDGVKITIAGHGPQDLTKKHVAMIVRQLEAAGFDRDTVRRELQGE